MSELMCLCGDDPFVPLHRPVLWDTYVGPHAEYDLRYPSFVMHAVECKLGALAARAAEREFQDGDGWEWLGSADDVDVFVKPHGHHGPAVLYRVELLRDPTFLDGVRLSPKQCERMVRRR